MTATPMTSCRSQPDQKDDGAPKTQVTTTRKSNHG